MSSEYYEQWATEYYVEHYERLREVVSGVLRNSSDIRVDDLMSDVVLEKLPAILRTWEPDRGATLDGHVARACRWYSFKSLTREDRRREVETPWSDAATDSLGARDPTVTELETRELIELLSDRLTRKQMLVLRRRFGEEMTISDMADKACVSRGLIYGQLRDALEAAREVLGE